MMTVTTQQLLWYLRTFCVCSPETSLNLPPLPQMFLGDRSQAERPSQRQTSEQIFVSSEVCSLLVNCAHLTQGGKNKSAHTVQS